MSETIWRATDNDGRCWYYGEKPDWSEHQFYSQDGRVLEYYGTEKPPPGECWEYTLTRKGDIDTDGDPIGWKIVGIGKDGSVLCEKGNGQRRRYSFADGAKEQPTGEAWERLTKERDEALRELANERARIGQVIAERDRTIEELRAKIERPEMPEVVRELVDAVCLEFPGFFAKKIAAVEAHYAPPFRIQGPGVYSAKLGKDKELVIRLFHHRQDGWLGYFDGTGAVWLFDDSGRAGGVQLTKLLRPLEG